MRLGHHVILDFFGCPTEKLNSPEYIRQSFHDAAIKARCPIVNECFHTFEPYGVSGVTIISTSHFAYHGWGEFGYAAIDLFTCDESIDIELAVEHLTQCLLPTEVSRTNMDRGVFARRGSGPPNL